MDKAMIHLGLAYVATALEVSGDRVKILDAGIKGRSEKRIARFIEESSPEVAGITALTPYYSKALNMLKLALPADTRETVQETTEVAKELNPDFVSFYAAIPYPGTELARIVEERSGKLPENWSDYRLRSSDVASSKMLANLNISELNEKEFRHFLKTAQVEFQMGRLLARGEIRAMGIGNLFEIIRLSYSQATSLGTW